MSTPEPTAPPAAPAAIVDDRGVRYVLAHQHHDGSAAYRRPRGRSLLGMSAFVVGLLASGRGVTIDSGAPGGRITTRHYRAA